MRPIELKLRAGQWLFATGDRLCQQGLVCPGLEPWLSCWEWLCVGGFILYLILCSSSIYVFFIFSSCLVS